MNAPTFFIVTLLCVFFSFAWTSTTTTNQTPLPKKCICGRSSQNRDSDDLEMRVVGGVLMKQKDHKFLAAIHNKEGFSCGGSIVSPFHILTAAHCVEDNKEEDMKVVLGVRRREKTKTAREYAVKEIIIHDGYQNVNDSFVLNDIALLRVDRIKFKNNMQPICIPFKNELEDAKFGAVAGWGKTTFNGTSSPLPLTATLRLMSPQECLKTAWGEAMGKIPNSEKMVICAYKPSVDACQGDSGGPFIAKGFGGTTFQIAVVSFGDECANNKGIPGMYMNLAYFSDWLETHLGGEQCERPY